MFRDLYKEANDNIRGDRAILDKAFLQAAQPEKKKSSVFKYSFVGTAVAAVMVIGAVFANPTVFTNRSETIGTGEKSEPTENVAVIATEADNVAAENSEIAIVSSIEDETPVNAADTTKVTAKRENEQRETAPKPPVSSDESKEKDDYSLTVMSLEDEDDAFVETATEEQVMFKITRPEADTEEATEEMTEEVAEVTVEAAVEVFSYLYDMSEFSDSEQGEYKNTEECIIENAADAIERAKNECKVEYDSVYVAYDPVEGVWRVTFSCDDEVASEQIVYMNSDGITQLIVYGE